MEARSRDLLVEARQRADAVRRQGVAEMERRRADALAPSAELAVAESIAEARRGARAAVLKARAALLDRIFADAALALRAAESSDVYRAGLAEALSRALTYVRGAAVVVRCSPTLAESIVAALGDREGVRIEASAAEPPGFIVESADGAVRVDESLPARLDRLRQQLSIELVQQIEEAG